MISTFGAMLIDSGNGGRVSWCKAVYDYGRMELCHWHFFNASSSNIQSSLVVCLRS